MRKFSKATRDNAGVCPRCGSSAFRVKRSGLGKVALGFLAPKTRVQCIGCKKEYRRG